jgi:hypothetical protein
MMAQLRKYARPPGDDGSPGSDDTASKTDRSSLESETRASNVRAQLLLSCVAKLERNWALSAALILGAIIVASVL